MTRWIRLGRHIPLARYHSLHEYIPLKQVIWNLVGWNPLPSPSTTDPWHNEDWGDTTALEHVSSVASMESVKKLDQLSRRWELVCPNDLVLASCYRKLAHIQASLRNQSIAFLADGVRSLQSAISVIARINPKGLMKDQRLAALWMDYASLVGTMGEWKDVLAALERALNIQEASVGWREANRNRGSGHLQLNLGRAHCVWRRKKSSALYYMERSLRVLENIDDHTLKEAELCWAKVVLN